MRVTVVSVNVRYSKPMADGSHKTVELGIEGSLTSSDEDWRAVQTDFYHQLGSQMRYVFSGNGSGKVAQAMPTTELPASQRAHWCEIHHCEYQRFSKDGKTWFSHKAPGGKWCKEAFRPP
jgi:hypothetical protein